MDLPDKALRKYLRPLFLDHYKGVEPDAVLREFKDLGGRDFGKWTASPAQVKACIDHIFNVRSRSREWTIESIKALDKNPDPRFEDEPLHVIIPSQGGPDEAETSQGSRAPVPSENVRKRGRRGDGTAAPPVDFAAMADANAEQVCKLQQDLDESRAHTAMLEDSLGRLNSEYATARASMAAATTDFAATRTQMEAQEIRAQDLAQRLQAEKDVRVQLEADLAAARRRLMEPQNNASPGAERASTSAAAPPAHIDTIRRLQQDNMVLRVHNAHQTAARENTVLRAHTEAGSIVDRRMRDEGMFDPEHLAESMLRDFDDPLRGLGLTPACAWTDAMDDALAKMTLNSEQERNRCDAPEEEYSGDDE